MAPQAIYDPKHTLKDVQQQRRNQQRFAPASHRYYSGKQGEVEDGENGYNWPCSKQKMKKDQGKKKTLFKHCWIKSCFERIRSCFSKQKPCDSWGRQLRKWWCRPSRRTWRRGWRLASSSQRPQRPREWSRHRSAGGRPLISSSSSSTCSRLCRPSSSPFVCVEQNVSIEEYETKGLFSHASHMCPAVLMC